MTAPKPPPADAPRCADLRAALAASERREAEARAERDAYAREMSCGKDGLRTNPPCGKCYACQLAEARAGWNRAIYDGERGALEEGERRVAAESLAADLRAALAASERREAEARAERDKALRDAETLDAIGQRVAKERDEARAEVERLRALHEVGREEICRLAERDRKWMEEWRDMRARASDLRAALLAVTDGMDFAGGDRDGMPECPWCHAPEEPHASDCTLLRARALAASPSPGGGEGGER